LENSQVDKSKPFRQEKILDYTANGIVTKTIIKKITGNISAAAFDAGQAWKEKISPFDTFVQIIEGKAEISIDDTSHQLDAGQSIIIPAHSRNTISAKERFKMLSTIIKSGYEEVV
jgi:quercetin dioxygenase-like cupin family protein